MEEVIQDMEARLRQAMLDSDVSALEELLADDLIFTTHTGEVLGKQADLDDHRKGVLKLTRLDLSDSRPLLYGEVAVVSVRATLAGTHQQFPFCGVYCFTRVWRRRAGQWKVVAAHVSALR